MPRSLLLAPFLAAVVACSAAPASDVSASSDELVTGGVCATLDYGPRPIAETYAFFDGNDAASAAVQRMLDVGLLAPFVGAGATIGSVNTDERSVRLVGEVFEGFKRAFPAETAGLTAPPVVVMETSVVNAFAMGNMVDESFAIVPKSPWLFMVNSGLLAHHNTDDELRGVIAHEIGHLILQTFLPDVQARVRHAYTLGEGSEDGILGEAQAHDPVIAARVGTLLADQTRVGAIATLGLNVSVPGPYVSLLFRLPGTVTAPTDESQAACLTISPKIQALATRQAAFLPHVAEGNLAPTTPTAEAKAELDRLSDDVLTATKACLAPGSLVAPLGIVAASLHNLPQEAAADATHPLHAKVVAAMLPLEVQIDAEMPDAPLADRILRAEAGLRAELAAIRTDPSLDLARVRVYDFEEDADDASMRVLAAIGHEPTSIAGFLLSTLPSAAKEACLADVAAGRPLSFGELYDVHPVPCWRSYHATQFAKALSSCPTTHGRRAPLVTHLPASIAAPPADISGISRR